ncbi:Probable protein phosphatase 2C 2 [Linum grandiflorum]
MSVAVASSPVFSPSSSLFLNIPRSPADSRILTPTSTLFNSPSSPLRFTLHRTSPPSSTAIASSSSSDASVSRRKRPPKLLIPVPAMGFGGSEEVAAADVDEVGKQRDGYAVFSKRGKRKRKFMEDRFSAAVDIQGDPKQAFFGVFDGHSGAEAAKFAAKNLGKNILKRISSNGGGDEKMEDAIKLGYLDTDSQFLKEETRGGSCCVTALIRQGHLIVSNAGDCRAVVSRDGVAEALTSDHRPGREDERLRIESTGGYVDMISGTWRIQGSLAVSRGIGDRRLKQWVTPEPETRILDIQPNDEFLILASDGLWDKVSNQEAVNIAVADLKQQQPLVACKKLVELSISKGSNDDITVMIIELGRYV